MLFSGENWKHKKKDVLGEKLLFCILPHFMFDVFVNFQIWKEMEISEDNSAYLFLAGEHLISGLTLFFFGVFFVLFCFVVVCLFYQPHSMLIFCLKVYLILAYFRQFFCI